LPFLKLSRERGAADASATSRFAFEVLIPRRATGRRRQQHAGISFSVTAALSRLNHAIKRDPRTGMRSADNNWDFWTLLPEACISHMS